MEFEKQTQEQSAGWIIMGKHLNSNGIRAVIIFWSSLGALAIYVLIFGASALLALLIISTIILSIGFISFLVYMLGEDIQS